MSTIETVHHDEIHRYDSDPKRNLGEALFYSYDVAAKGTEIDGVPLVADRYFGEAWIRCPDGCGGTIRFHFNRNELPDKYWLIRRLHQEARIVHIPN